jgi:hypothetical protein
LYIFILFFKKILTFFYIKFLLEAKSFKKHARWVLAKLEHG